MQLIPLGKKVLIKPVEEKQSCLIITNKKSNHYEVLAIGDEVKKVEAGNQIYVEIYARQEIEYEKERYIVIEENQIIAKINTEIK